MVADCDLDEPDAQIPQLIGDLVEPLLDHLVRLEVSPRVELARGDQQERAKASVEHAAFLERTGVQ
jgi:hypothetical protein